MGDFEVGGAEAVEESNEAVGMTAADGQDRAAKLLPGGGVAAVELFVVDAAKELGVGGGTASGPEPGVLSSRSRLESFYQ